MSKIPHQDLYKKLLPVLKTKMSSLESFGMDYINEEDIWNFLTTKYFTSLDGSIDELVADILNVPNYLIKDYLLEELKNRKKTNINDLL